MNVKKVACLALLAIWVNLSVATDVYAAGIRVKCEVRGTSRSKVSVDGSGLRGAFYAVVKSGVAGYRSKLPNKVANSKGEVEFDFDSNSSDIRAGASAIPANFIKNRTVYGYIRNSSNLLVGTMRATCIAK
jgi:hypothetical protein